MSVSVPVTTPVVRIVEESPEVHEARDILPFEFPTKAAYSNYRRRLWDRDHNCRYCGVRIKSGHETLDHVVPKSHGGLDTPSNLVLCCEGCNQIKRDRSLVEWVADLSAHLVEGGVTC